MQSEVQQLHEFFAELDNLSLLDLPRDQDEFEALANKYEVREPAAVYSIRRPKHLAGYGSADAQPNPPYEKPRKVELFYLRFHDNGYPFSKRKGVAGAQ